MNVHWYVLSSKPNKEESLYYHAVSSGYEVYYPTIAVKSTNPTARKNRPYFPGYMFIQADLDELGISKIRWMPYTNGLVTFGGEPPSVPDVLIAAIRNKVNEISQTISRQTHPHLQAGEKVTILEGPFAGYEAIFDIALDGRARSRVLLHLLSGRTIPVEIRTGSIQRSNRADL
ncbi:MAG TPA: transcription termination/antitermination NusG family protein [Anaerolineaceae bacterium]|nr:transcription termination/antitermination NusG family protein [Anaerolineaceae bacterium]